MKLLFSRNCRHFTKNIASNQIAKATIKQFNDGELYVKIEENLFDQIVWIIASTVPPAESILELLFILDALQRNKVTINLLLTYTAYMRQDRAQPGEALSAEVFFRMLGKFAIKKTILVHCHSERVKQFYNFENYIPYEFFYQIAQKVDTIVAPDIGAYHWAEKIAKFAKKELLLIEKRRPDHDNVELVAIGAGSIEGKKLLIVDDVISTGKTIVMAADALKKQGAGNIFAAATHGIFSEDALTRLTQSCLNKIHVTNSINQTKINSKIEIIDIWPMIQKIM